MHSVGPLGKGRFWCNCHRHCRGGKEVSSATWYNHADLRAAVGETTGQSDGSPTLDRNHGHNSYFQNNLTSQHILLNATHEQLLANPFYRSSIESIIRLQAQNNALTSAYTLLATTIPQVFSVPPNPLGIQTPAVNTSNTSLPQAPAAPTLSQDDYPSVRWWTRQAWKKNCKSHGDQLSLPKKKKLCPKNDSDLSDDDKDNSDTVDDDDNDPEEDTDGKLNLLGFLEHADGTPFTENDRGIARKHAHELYQTLLVAQRAPHSWSHADLEVITFVRNHLTAKFSAFAFGEDNWKADMFATSTYAQWARYRKASLLPDPKKVKSPKRKGESSHENAKATKRRKRSSDASPVLPKLPKIMALELPPADSVTPPPSAIEHVIPLASTSHSDKARTSPNALPAADAVDVSPSDQNASSAVESVHAPVDIPTESATAPSDSSSTPVDHPSAPLAAATGLRSAETLVAAGV